MKQTDNKIEQYSFDSLKMPPRARNDTTTSGINTYSTRNNRNTSNDSNISNISNIHDIEETGAIFRSMNMNVNMNLNMNLAMAMDMDMDVGLGLSNPSPLSSHPLGAIMKGQTLPFTCTGTCSGMEMKMQMQMDQDLCCSPQVLPTMPRAGEEWVWKLSKHPPLPVPPYHPIERTAVVISDMPANEIAQRISLFLKQHSIPAHYETGRVSCMTDELLKFVIQLWQCSEGVIVEVQRRQGCCIAMHTIRQRLLAYIQSGDDTSASASASASRSHCPPIPPPMKPSRATCGMVQSLVDQLQLPDIPTQDDYSHQWEAALELTKEMLQSNRLDAQRLGLESLCSMTNPNHALLRHADYVSHTILLEPEWQKLMIQFFYDSTGGFVMVDRHHHHDEEEKAEDDFGEVLHFLALKIITQAIESVASLRNENQDENNKNNSSNNNNNKNHYNPSLDISTPFWSILLEDLFRNLTMAAHRPLEASWSIRCFRYLQMIQPELLHWIPNRTSLRISLIQAHDFGKQHHLSLEQETEQWMGRLGFAY